MTLLKYHQSVLGQIGEMLACEYLRKKGYRILEKNFRTRHGEIDIIAKDGPSLAFVEVKTRASDTHGQPLESIGAVKKKRLKLAAQQYFQERSVFGEYAEFRFDALGIVMREGEEAVMELVRGAFYSGEIL